MKDESFSYVIVRGLIVSSGHRCDKSPCGHQKAQAKLLGPDAKPGLTGLEHVWQEPVHLLLARIVLGVGEDRSPSLSPASKKQAKQLLKDAKTLDLQAERRRNYELGKSLLLETRRHVFNRERFFAEHRSTTWQITEQIVQQLNSDSWLLFEAIRSTGIREW